ncbi:MAG: H-NS family nucleoid-associated regulatory protein [Rubrivivax sp.]|jgi:DNA-binding protein H-NS
MARTLAQINAEIEKLKKQAEELKSREVREVVARIKQAIKHYGLTPRDLFGKAGAAGAPAGRGKATSSANAAQRRTKSKAAGVIRFRDDAGNGWVGRGKRPNWFKAALAAGKTPEDLAVN